MIERRLRRRRDGVVIGLWAGLVASVAGVLFDLRWHATHDEFEGAAEQLEAHWLMWLGAALLLVAATAGLRERGRAANVGTAAVLGGAAAYAALSVWHFAEHNAGRDPEVVHVLLTVAQVAMLGAVPVAVLLARRASAARGAARG